MMHQEEEVDAGTKVAGSEWGRLHIVGVAMEDQEMQPCPLMVAVAVAVELN